MQTLHLVPGVYITVGSERGFIGASLANIFSHVILLDYDPMVVRFNRFNIGLLSLAENRKDYNHLRFKASYEEIQQRIKRKELSPKIVLELSSTRMFSWWRALMLKSKSSDFATMEMAFWGSETSYLLNDQLFERLHVLAKEGKIIGLLANLGDPDHIERLATELTRKSLKISLLDFSNAWWGQFMGLKGVEM